MLFFLSNGINPTKTYKKKNLYTPYGFVYRFFTNMNRHPWCKKAPNGLQAFFYFFLDFSIFHLQVDGLA